MMLNVTNLGDAAELLASPDGSLVLGLEPGVTLPVDQPSHDVMILGDKPDARETIERGAKGIAEVIERVVRVVFNRKRARESRNYPEAESVVFEVENLGASPIRAILGDGVTDQTIAAGGMATLTSAGYVELRELGLVDTPDSADPGKSDNAG